METHSSAAHVINPQLYRSRRNVSGEMVRTVISRHRLVFTTKTCLIHSKLYRTRPHEPARGRCLDKILDCPPNLRRCVRIACTNVLWWTKAVEGRRQKRRRAMPLLYVLCIYTVPYSWCTVHVYVLCIYCTVLVVCMYCVYPVGIWGIQTFVCQRPCFSRGGVWRPKSLQCRPNTTLYDWQTT